MSYPMAVGQANIVPVEILAFCLYIVHAISHLPLFLLPGLFLLGHTHSEGLATLF